MVLQNVKNSSLQEWSKYPIAGSWRHGSSGKGINRF